MESSTANKSSNFFKYAFSSINKEACIFIPTPFFYSGEKEEKTQTKNKIYFKIILLKKKKKSSPSVTDKSSGLLYEYMNAFG